MSAATTTYVVPVAPNIAQLLPATSQRSQSYEKFVRYSLAHVPLLAVSVCPTCAVPVIVGSPVLVGPAPAPVTTEVAFEVAVPFPSLLKALTWRRTVKPTSAPARV